jgi:hypothetical protein
MLCHAFRSVFQLSIFRRCVPVAPSPSRQEVNTTPENLHSETYTDSSTGFNGPRGREFDIRHEANARPYTNLVALNGSLPLPKLSNSRLA